MSKEPDMLSGAGRPLFFKLAKGEGGLTAPPLREGRGEAIRLVVRSLSVMQKEALVVSARTGATWRLASDEGAYLDGHDVAPCPLSFFSTGMVASYMNEINALARMRGVELRDLTLVQENFYTMKGSARDGTMTGGAKDVKLEVRAATDASEEILRALAYDAVAASPVNGLMREEKESLFSLSHNGSPLPPLREKSIPPPPQPDFVRLFEDAQPSEGDWSELIRRGGPSPENENTKTFSGGSLNDHQDRLLHVRVTCRQRDDGVKEIEQHLHNPHGSTFHYLCDEAPENGGRGLAPDAASYLAAGVGFCFMTQLGRYAKIVRRPLSSYQISQDLHLSLGGASGGTGKAGVVDPIETHVYLECAEDDDFARSCLTMSEQTCFLHAFCRMCLGVLVRVVGI